MGEFKRKSDGRRIFTSDFKRATVEARIRSAVSKLGEKPEIEKVSEFTEIARVPPPEILGRWPGAKAVRFNVSLYRDWQVRFPEPNRCPSGSP